jgi:hypothetical protein
MSELDRNRVALVVAAPARSGAAGESSESVGTGYFLTGDLVLTARHVGGGRDWEFRVRAEGGGSEEARWSPAEPCWVGAGDVDAMLLRTQRRFGDWAPPAFPAFTDGGTWKSAGYAKAAADEQHDNRKTLPLNGSFDMSLGQGPQELALQTSQIISERWDDYWKGISGAPVFAMGSGEGDGMIGIITDASRALRNGLVGLPAARLLEDIGFQSIIASVIAPSSLSWLPATPWCLVLTSEGWRSDLFGKTADVLSGYREEFGRLYPQPIEIPVLEAIESARNWAATVNALARADYLIADVTSFEPAVMLLLGIRSVLRRGVTISVAAGKPAVLASSVPFNVRETRVLPYGEPNLYERLHAAMAEGAANLGRDSNYLDLPAYQAVRIPRPERWAEDDRQCLLILCSFGERYSAFYEETLESIISGKTKNKTLLRMMDLTSPRLVGQALYEQIRWSSRCLVDWTDWRPNVFFELGVRLACSEHDPLCIIQQDDESGPRDAHGRQPLQQYGMLRRLLEPVVYDPANPRKALNSALEPWSGEALPPNVRTPSQDALPPAATFRTAQASFAWQRDGRLTAPHVEQREAAERIFGKDPERRPERLVLFADNVQFDEELRAAVREKWIAAWLYLNHLSNADETSEARAELITYARLVEYALSSSDNPRHIALRKEIRNFLRADRSRRRARESDSSNG